MAVLRYRANKQILQVLWDLFKCYICGTRLALKTYCNNRNDINDQEIFCANHVPNANPHDPMPLKMDKMNGAKPGHFTPDSRFDAGLQDLKIAHAMKATQVAKPYPKIKHGGAKYVVVSSIYSNREDLC